MRWRYILALYTLKMTRTKSNKNHNRIYLLAKTKYVSETALTNKSSLNKAHDTWIRTYKQAATAATANKPDITKGRKN